MDGRYRAPPYGLLPAPVTMTASAGSPGFSTPFWLLNWTLTAKTSLTRSSRVWTLPGVN